MAHRSKRKIALQIGGRRWKNIADLIPPSVNRKYWTMHTCARKITSPGLQNLAIPRAVIGSGLPAMQSANWTLVFQIPRAESLVVVEPIRTNTLAAMAITFYCC
jgi:hypothetical protein